MKRWKPIADWTTTPCSSFIGPVTLLYNLYRHLLTKYCYCCIQELSEIYSWQMSHNVKDKTLGSALNWQFKYFNFEIYSRRVVCVLGYLTIILIKNTLKFHISHHHLKAARLSIQCCESRKAHAQTFYGEGDPRVGKQFPKSTPPSRVMCLISEDVLCIVTT